MRKIDRGLCWSCACKGSKSSLFNDIMCIMSHQFSGVSNVATEVDVNLKDITALLDNEVEEEENFQVLEFKKKPHQL